MGRRLTQFWRDERGQFIVRQPPVASSGTVIQPSDLTQLGAFAAPTDVDFGAGLTFRYVAGQFRLYSLDHSGNLLEYVPVSDGLLTLSGSGFSQAIVLHSFGDIYQAEIYRAVDDGSGVAPPVSGLANVGSPNGIFWDPIDSRLYWCKTAFYNNTVSTADTCLGYSTLDDTTHTGTGRGMWKLSPPSPAGFQDRWCFGMTPIPTAFAGTYCVGRRLGVGFGGGLSIISNGPPSLGPTLFAMNPPTLGLDPDHDYITTGLTRLLGYPAGTAQAPRDSTLQCNQDFPDAFNGQKGVWNWNDGFGGATSSVWIDGPNKQGFLSFCLLAGSTLNTTVSATPAPTHNVFTVADASGVAVGDLIRYPTDTTISGPDYPFVFAAVTGVSGNQLTVANQTQGFFPQNADTSGIPIVGAQVYGGGFYTGGGQCATRWYSPLYIYDPADLARIAQGTMPAWGATPVSMVNFALAGQPYPFAGTTPNQVPRPGQTAGACFDPATKRLYVLYRGLPANGGHIALVYVFTVNC